LLKINGNGTVGALWSCSGLALKLKFAQGRHGLFKVAIKTI
jgi:hypothetical protein